MISQNFACFVMIKYEKKYQNKPSLVNKHIFRKYYCVALKILSVARTALAAFISLTFHILMFHLLLFRTSKYVV